MSLTQFLKIEDVRDKFKEFFPKPRYKVENEVVAPPVTKNYSLVGTAFDYLLRFQLEYWYPSTVSRGWVASYAPLLVKNITKRNKIINALKICREQHAQFLKTGVVDKSLLRTCIVLAQLDVVFRRKALVSDFLQFNEGDLRDLNQLLKIVPRNMFSHRNICLLDPTFNEGSRLVGGADVDLVVDDMIIDIKTTKNPSLQRRHFNQIIGYYMLSRIGSIDGAPKEHEIRRLGIYFSRFATLFTFDVQDVIQDDIFDKFLPWFIDRARTEFDSYSVNELFKADATQRNKDDDS